MINQAIRALERALSYLTALEAEQRQQLSELHGYEDFILVAKTARNGKPYYSARLRARPCCVTASAATKRPKPGKSSVACASSEMPSGRKYRYLGDLTHPTVKKIKDAHYLSKSISLVVRDRIAVSKALRTLEPLDIEHVLELLPATYRGDCLGDSSFRSEKAKAWKEATKKRKASVPEYKPEHLKSSTCDGNHVRSKSEAIIYNMLVMYGITFEYELPTIINGVRMVPDFTILSELDWQTEIIIEHQGLMSSDTYSAKFAKKLQDYIQAGYTPGINLILSFDSADGALDASPILDALACIAVPRLRADTGKIVSQLAI